MNRNRWDSAVNIESRGAISGNSLSSGARTANAAAINSAISIAGLMDVDVILPPKRYEVAGTLDATGHNFLSIFGGGPSATEIVQYTDNVPILKIGTPSGTTFNEGVTVDGLRLSYNTRQVGNTSASGLWLGGLFASQISNVRVDNAYTGISSEGSDMPQFSCEFRDLQVRSWAGRAVFLTSSIGSSGNIYYNIYMNASISGTEFDTYTVTGVMKIENCASGVFNQINLEACHVTEGALELWSAQEVVLNSTSFEQISSQGDRGLVLNVAGQSKFSGVSVYNCRFRAADGCTKAAIFVPSDNSTTTIDGLRVDTITPTSLSFYLVQSADLGSGTPDHTVYLQNYWLKSGHSAIGLSNVLVGSGGSIKRDPVVLAGSSMGVGDGVFTQGDASLTYKSELYPRHIRFNTALTAQRTVTLDDSIHATDSVYPPTGATVKIWRTANATGAFNLLVNNNAGTTLQTLSAATQGVECVFISTDWEKVRSW